MERELADILDNPEALEKIYREDEAAFRGALLNLTGERAHSMGARFWRARLGLTPATDPAQLPLAPNPDGLTESDAISIFAVDTDKVLAMTLGLCLVSGTFLKVLWETSIFAKNVGFAFFLPLCMFFLLINNARRMRYALLGTFFAVSAIYINVLPNAAGAAGDSVTLVSVFLPFLFWFVLGLSYSGLNASPEKRVSFLRFNGDLITLATLFLIAGAILVAVTSMLFFAIEMNPLEPLSYAITYGVASATLVSAYIIHTRRSIVEQVSGVVAKIFTPLTFIALASFLVAVLVSGENPYMDRDFLVLLNFILVGVAALTVFSITGHATREAHGYASLMLCLTVVILNGFALSAIVFRLAEFGTTPNRIAVLGTNVLLFIHLSLILVSLYSSLRKMDGFTRVEKAVVRFLPAYTIWSTFVILGLPILFKAW